MGNDYFAWNEIAPPPSHILSLILSPYPRSPLQLTHRVFLSMAPVVRIEPNGNQSLLLFDNSHKDLENSGWLVFI